MKRAENKAEEDKVEEKKEAEVGAGQKMVIGGDLKAAAILGKPVVINTDAGTDDARAVVEILIALNHIIKANALEAVNVAMVVGDGDPSKRLNIIATLVEKIKEDGLLNNKINITYILGEEGTGEGNHPILESVIEKHITTNKTGMDVSFASFMEEHAQDGALIYGIKEPQELQKALKDNPEIFAKSDLYAYFGGHNFRLEHGDLPGLMKSFHHVTPLSNYVALQDKNNFNPRDITLENTPKISALMLKGGSKTLEFLKNITIALNTEVIFKMCNKKLNEEVVKLEKSNKEELDNAIGNGAPEEKIVSINAKIKAHNEAIEELRSKIDSIRRADDGQVDLDKMDVNFIKTLAPLLKMLPQKFPVSMWGNLTAEPEIQSVVADDLPIIASFLEGFVGSGIQGYVEFDGKFLIVKLAEEGNAFFPTKVANHNIGMIDDIISELFKETLVVDGTQVEAVGVVPLGDLD